MNDARIETIVAKALFYGDLKSTDETFTTEEKKAKWTEHKTAYRKSARLFIRHLNSQNLSLSMTEVEA